jgi:hypothetical protein
VRLLLAAGGDVGEKEEDSGRTELIMAALHIPGSAMDSPQDMVQRLLAGC